MVGELDVLNEWIPEQMQPGTVFVLENAGEIGEKEDPYWAVLSCPSCGMLGLITRKQINGFLPVICGSESCSAQFFIRDSGSRRTQTVLARTMISRSSHFNVGLRRCNRLLAAKTPKGRCSPHSPRRQSSLSRTSR